MSVVAKMFFTDSQYNIFLLQHKRSDTSMNSKLQPETIDISPVYICYGASGNDGHEFKIMAPPESP